MAVESTIPLLPAPRTTPPRTAIGRWMTAGERLSEPKPNGGAAHPWYKVLWLTGVDYFSTLGYQPGIALLAAGALAPAATSILVLVTLLGAVPVYAEVARRSYAGQGSIAMLEALLPEWSGKIFVLALLGFAATDFVITMTLSAADAAQHAVENPLLHPFLGEHRLSLTLALLLLLATVFIIGFREAIRVAMVVAVPYIGLNLVVLLRGLAEIVMRPEVVGAWRADLAVHGDGTALFLAAALVFPRLALGLSGFETGVSVMPLVQGGAEDATSAVPHGRIHATRRLLLAAALIMCGMLLLSSVVTTLLIPAEAYDQGGPASGRAIAYLAHGLLGSGFGTLYDLWTIAILWFAGASAMAGLLNLLPRYLPRFGMAPQWTEYRRPLVLILFVVSVVVTLIFGARVEAQAGAYATGVLALILSAAVAVALTLWKEFRHGGRGVARARTLGLCLFFWVVTAVFTFTFIDNVISRPDGVIIASVFILGIMVIGAVSRWLRSTELRVSEIRFVDDESAARWSAMTGKKVNLVPVRSRLAAAKERKAADLRRHYAVTGPLAFLHIHFLDDRSEFLAPLRIKVTQAGEDFVIHVYGAVSIANTIAYVSELLDPIRLFLSLTGENQMVQALRYLVWGEGEIGIMVYRILLRYWEWTTGEEDVRPLIFLMRE
ncbi:MAG TPA: hypothetical protein VGV60_07605 [Candidatus Polarisedimenticolia bacterium]|jgi:hypothetical protein|nr:hypothetical protein [Candidatus Polarisedimenticolia bacterium]